MTESMCRSLRRLGWLLRSAYRLRDNRLASSKDGTGLAYAELDLLRSTISSPAIVPSADTANSMNHRKACQAGIAWSSSIGCTES